MQHAIKTITVGKNSGKPLNPSDIEFNFYSYGRHIDEDGKRERYPSFELITHKYDECKGHHVESQPIFDYKEIDIAQTYLLAKELIQVTTAIIENCEEDEYIELLHHSLDSWIQDGYEVLSKYDDIEIMEG